MTNDPQPPPAQPATPQPPPTPSPTLEHPLVPAHYRRLSDKLLIVFHSACDANDLEVARQLLTTLELMMTRRPRPEEANRRRNFTALVAAHERLWTLTNRTTPTDPA